MTIDAKQVARIDDDRLKGYTKRTRSGRTQVFYIGSDSRDFDHYNKDGGGSKHGVKMHDKPDTINLEPPEIHYYAELIEGEWWWVNGCAECNGQPRDWMTYIECEKHNVCRTCKITRSELTEPPWGGKHGWQCVPCSSREHEEKKSEALAAMPEEYDKWDYYNLDTVCCPHCNLEVEDSGDGELYKDGGQEIDCGRCDNTFTLTTEFTPTYTMTRKGEDDE
tara:strand:- start:36648 stop:37310 length:663 start_codon:yes stop_codon:yes gene_type:complete